MLRRTLLLLLCPFLACTTNTPADAPPDAHVADIPDAAVLAVDAAIPDAAMDIPDAAMDVPDAAVHVDPCEGVTALMLTVSPAVIHVGDMALLMASGGSGMFEFSIIPSEMPVSGTLLGAAFEAGLEAGMVEFSVADAQCPSLAHATAELRVVEPFDVTPHSGTLPPAATFSLRIRGNIGAPSWSLRSSTAGSQLSAEGLYTAGPSNGDDDIQVTDTATDEVRSVHFQVRAGAVLRVVPSTVVLAPGASTVLRHEGGTDQVQWMVRSGPAHLEGTRVVMPQNGAGPSVLDVTDPFTLETAALDVRVMQPLPQSAISAVSRGAAVQLVRVGEGYSVVTGAPEHGGWGLVEAFPNGLLPAQHLHDEAFGERISGGAAGTSLAATDFNGDGRLDVVIGMPALHAPDLVAWNAGVSQSFAGNSSQCISAQDANTGAFAVALQQADGRFAQAYRFWIPASATPCASGGPACPRGALGLQLAGSLDFNGDGRGDVAVGSTSGVDVVLGRAPADATLATLTLACDPVVSRFDATFHVTSVAALDDLDGDGCDEAAMGFQQGTGAGVSVLFGHDSGGARCGGRTTLSVVTLRSTSAGFGAAVVNARQLLGGATKVLAISDGVTSTISLVSAAAVVTRRAPSGVVDVNVTEAGVLVGEIPAPALAEGFGAGLLGGVDLVGDTNADLVVSAPGSTFSGSAAGAVFIYAGGQMALEPSVVLVGDDRTPAQFGRSMSVLAEQHVLAVGDPLQAGAGSVYVWAPIP